MPQTWLVTGAAGFIGSNVCARLLQDGDRVVGIDNFTTGKVENVARLEKLGGQFSFVRGDVRDPGVLVRAAGRADVVVHLAAQVAVQRSIENFTENDAINVGGFLNVLAQVGDLSAAAFIYASSCAVYGDNPNLPLAETMRPNPLSPYGLSKLVNELYAGLLDGRMAGTRLVGFRFFNIYGPWQDASGGYAAVIPRWIELCLKGERPIMFGDGTASRDFCFVDDVARLISLAGRMPDKLPHGIYNVGSGRATELRALFAAIVEAVRASGVTVPFDDPETHPWRSGDIVHSLADTSKTQRELGFSADTSLQEGLRVLLHEQYGYG